jgi:subtilisin family serine protease
VLYPARHPGLMSVGAVGIEMSTQYYKRADFSNYDDDDYHVNVMAPGVGIYSCIPLSYRKLNHCGWFNGTSLAAPWVTAIYAWVIAANIEFDLMKISHKLYYQRVDDPFDGPHGYGMIKFDKVLEIVRRKEEKDWLCGIPRPKSKPSGDCGSLDPSASLPGGGHQYGHQYGQ